MLMKESALAKQLRARLLNQKLIPARLLARVSDHDVILSYTKCCECGAKFIDDAQLETVIEQVESAKDFVELCCHGNKTQHGN